METLFGMNPEDIQAQRQAQVQAQAMRFAQMSPAERATMGFYQAGNQLGGALAGMMGAKDPQLERAATINKLVQNTDMNDLESVKGLVGQLNKVGATREAMSLLPRIDALTKTMEDRETRKADREARLEIAKSKNTSRDPSLTGDERMAKFVAEVQDKIDNGEEVSKKDMNQAKLYAEILRKQKTFVDKEGRLIGVDQRDVPTLTPAAPQGATQAAGGMRVIETPTSKKAETQTTTGKLINQLDFQSDLANVDTALSRVSGWSTGFGALLSGLPTSEAMALNDIVESIKSGQFLNNLKALKEASATGASGLGSVTEKEGAKVEAKVRALNPKSKTFVEDLKYIRSYMQKLQDIKEGKQVEGEQAPTSNPPAAAPRNNKIITDAIIQRVIEHNGGRGTREQAIRSLQKAGWTLP